MITVIPDIHDDCSNLLLKQNFNSIMPVFQNKKL